jgi:hypothetical protein
VRSQGAQSYENSGMCLPAEADIGHRRAGNGSQVAQIQRLDGGGTVTMPDMQHVEATQHRARRRGWGPPLALAALAAVLSLALAGPALAAERPTVTKVEPTKGLAAGGTTVGITGTNFTGVTAVKFGVANVNATEFTVNSETRITAVSPPAVNAKEDKRETGTVDVTVTNGGGTSATSPADQFAYVAAPTVTKVEPAKGPEAGGTTVTITGTNFFMVTEVEFGGLSAKSFTVNSETSITAVSPPGRGTVEVRVATGGGQSAISSADQFFYEAPCRACYKKNGVFLAEGALGKTFIQGWGTLKLQTVIDGTASYTCRDAEGGYIENPTGGGAGVGATELYSSYQCTFTACPTFPSVLAEELPWSEVLVEPEAGVIRARTTGIKQDYQCWGTKGAFEKARRGEGELPNARNVFIGSPTPKVEPGASAGHPGFLEFGPAAGRLEQEGSAGTIQAETVGKVKVLGYKEQELISVE